MIATKPRTPSAMAKTTITAFVEEEIKEALKALAETERRSMSQLVSLLVEDAVRAAIKDGRIADPSQTKSKK